MHKWMWVVAWMLCCAFGLQAQSAIEGKLIDKETNEPIIGANIALYKNGILITGTDTDAEGNYAISNLDPGTYDIEFSYTGYQSQRQNGVIIYAGKLTRLNVGLEQGLTLTTIEVIDYKVPLIEQDNTTSGGIVTAEKIRFLPTKSINQLAATTAGISSIDGGAISVRGSRTNATDYYIDGVRVQGNLIPQTEIDQLQVITGGIEARYGDVTGGIISITTKGPSAKFSGGIEAESSKYLDAFGYNLLNFNLSGPIFKRKNGNPLLGFRVSGQYLSQEDDDPPATGAYRVSETKIKELETTPTARVLGTTLSTAEGLQMNDAQLLKAQPNEDNQRLDLTGKLEAQITKGIDLSLTGNYNSIQNQFTPGGWGLLNYTHNPTFYSHGYRTNLRLRHRIGYQGPEEVNASKALIRNFTYTLQAGYEKAFTRDEDPIHQDRLFDYGYVGKFDVTWIPVEGESAYTKGPAPGLAHAGYLQVLEGYTPGTINPTLANYNLGQNPSDLLAYNAFNGFWSANYNTVWRIHSNVGAVYNRFSKGESEILTFNGNGSFDLVPGKSSKGRHNIQFGVTLEERRNRSWAVAPNGLWTIGRLQANDHIIGVDTNQVIGTFQGQTIPFQFEQFRTLIAEDPDLLFYKRVREVTGQTLYDYVNVDGLNPDQLALDMFSVRELTDQGLMDYYGFDYLGRKASQKLSFKDFFTQVDAAGKRTYPVAPNRPTYAAAYIQDKFSFKDIIFRVGVRVDRYDANTMVLKDPFSLYEIMDAKNFYSAIGAEKPANVADDFLVYIENSTSNKVKAYRRGEQWYLPNGTAANDGNIIFGGEIVQPKYVNPEANIKNKDFDYTTSFEDYKPQINWMPRLAFSFPISEEANFFAHYDILVQRPPSNTIATPLDYFYFEDAGRTPSNNPNLRPERTIDYEVGFQQKISNSSALKIAAYYKEMRDMIQSRTYLYIPAPVNTYESYGNLDFGTVKGFSFQYDLRRTNNLEFTANYTLQFADGTGSNSNSQRGLNTRGNIRTLFPLSFDERHRFVTTFDYRYGQGNRYNGPRILGLDFLSNAGLNLQANAVSGRPYTKLQRAQPFTGTGFKGAINVARLPLNFTLDLRLDKSFRIGNDQNNRPVFVNAYLRVQNVLDRRNVVGVYPVTGSPDDDGYLTSSDGRSALNTIITSGRDVDAYLASYSWALNNPDLFSLPRRVFLGAIIEF